MLSQSNLSLNVYYTRISSPIAQYYHNQLETDFVTEMSPIPQQRIEKLGPPTHSTYYCIYYLYITIYK